jgi:Spy/CpxP family protein refolding chaperone
MSVASHVLNRAGVASVGLLALVLSAAMPSATIAQDQPGQGGRGPGGPGGGPGGPGGGRGNFDPEQFRQRIAERMKEVLGANDEEWGVIQPKLEKVMTLQRQSAGGRGMGMLFGGGRGGRGQGGGGDRGDRGPGGDRGDRGPRGGPFGDDDSAVSQRSRDLQQAVESNASSDELKAKLAALREARAKAREDLTKAQAELRELLTMKQEASLVMMGMLE